MIDAVPWMQEAVKQLLEKFGDRLLFVGLQGSYRRNEAREDSDFDILAVLDTLDVNDLCEYRELLRAMPEGYKAHGFISGQKELYAWPKFELFQLSQEVDAYHGNLMALLPKFTRKDIKESAHIASSAIYHATSHTYMAGDVETRVDELRSLYKGFFFVMQVVHYLRHGEYIRTKQEMVQKLEGMEAEILKLGMHEAYFNELKENNPDALFEKLLSWSGEILRTIDNAC